MVLHITRKLRKIALFFIFIFTCTQSFSQTIVNGIINGNTTFTTAGSPYIVDADLTVGIGATLTINPGVMVRFELHTSLLVQGELIANGTALNPIVFTANTPSPSAGYWGGISFGTNAMGANTDASNNYLNGSIINYASISYAGSPVSNVFGAIATTGNGVPYINHVMIRYCSYPGVYSINNQNKLVVKNTSVQSCSANSSFGPYINLGAGVNVQNSSNDVIVDSCLIEGNTGTGVSITGMQGPWNCVVSYSRILSNINSVTSFGGGLLIDPIASVYNNIISRNTAINGGGIAVASPYNPGGNIFQNLIYGNNATDGAALYGTIDNVYSNVFTYNIGTVDIVKAQDKQWLNFNQFISNKAAVIYNYGGTSADAAINRNSFSNNIASVPNASVLQFVNNTPANATDNNFMENDGFIYTMKLENNNNTANLAAQNNYWKTSGALSVSAIQTITYDQIDAPNQGLINFQPFEAIPRTDCPISGIFKPKKVIIGDTVLVYWNPKSGENVAAYQVHYGGSNGTFFNMVHNNALDTFFKISIFENIDSIAVNAVNSSATKTVIDFITGAQSWYTFADWENSSNPTITSFYPSSATIGDTVIITGTNFTGTTNVAFHRNSASSHIVTGGGTEIKAVVGPGSTGNVKVTTPIGVATLSGFTYVPRPVLYSFSPPNAKAGQTVTIKGVQLSGSTAVTFGGTNAALYTILGDTQINAVLGTGSSGLIIVTNPFGADTLNGFTLCGNIALNLSDTSRICGDSILLSVPSGFSSYLWSNGNLTNSFYAKANGTYSVHVVNSLGCEGDDTTFVILNTLPTPVVSGIKFPCSGTTQTYTTTNNSGRTYTWQVTGGTISSGNGTSSIDVLWGAAGPGSVIVKDSVNASGCKGTSNTFGIVINATPNPVISGEDSVCAASIHGYKTPSGTGHTYTWSVTGGVILNGQGTDSITVLWAGAGSRTMEVTDSVDATGCKATSSTLSVLVSLVPNPVVSGPASICSGNTGIYSTTANLGRSYRWTVSANGTIVSGQGTSSLLVQWNSVGAGTVVVEDSVNLTGCKGTSSIFDVIVNTTPTPVITGEDTVCSGTPLVYSTPANTGRNYLWTITGGTITSGQGTSSVQISWGAAGAGSLRVRDSVNATGCSATTANFPVLINPIPSPVIVGQDSSCANASLIYTTNSITGHSYRWAVTGGSIILGQGTAGVAVTWGAAGTGTITVTDSIMATGCKTTTSPMNIRINANPTPAISGPVLVCSGSSNVFNTPANSGRSYLWNINGGVITSGAGTASVTVLWGAVGAGSLQVTDSVNVSGCKASSTTHNVTINANPSPVATGEDTLCQGDIRGYKTTLTSGHSYLWTLNGGTIQNGQGTDSVTVLWNLAGNRSISVQDSINVTGCKASSPTINVLVVPIPNPVISGPNSVCMGSTVSYSIPSNPGRTYRWAVSSNGTILSGQGTASISVNWSTALPTGTVVAQDSVNATGCKGTSSVYNVALNPVPTPVISGPASVCVGSTVYYSTPKNSGRTYTWTLSGGTIVSGQGTDSLQVLWSTLGSGTLRVKDSVNASGCVATTGIFPVVIGVMPTPTISGRDSSCEGSTFFYTTTGSAGHTYTWNITGGVLGLGQGTSSIVVTWGSAGTGTITVTDSMNGSSCKGTSALFNVRINPNPSPVVSGQIAVCEGTSIAYSTPTNAGSIYTWAVTGGVVSSGDGTSNVMVTWGTPGPGSLVVRDSLVSTGCKALSASLPVTINPNPTPVISGENNVCTGLAKIYNTPSNTGRSYLWTINGGTILGGQGTASIIVSWTTVGPGTLTVKDSVTGAGCKTTTPLFNVQVNANPTPVITGPTAVCSGGIANYSTPSNTGRAYVWTISGGSILSGQGTATISVSWSTIGSGTLTVSDSIIGGGCKTTTSPYVVNVTANPSPTVSGTNMVCAGSIFNYSTINNTGRAYVWTINGGAIISGQGTSSIVVQWGAAGFGDVTVSDSVLASGCKATSPSFSVNIISSPSPAISGGTEACINSIATYSTPFNTGRFYNWTVVGGTIFAGQGTSDLTVLWDVFGKGSVTVSDSIDGTGCIAYTAPYKVNVISNPIAIISGANELCANATTQYGTINNASRTFIWSVDGGSIISGQGTSNVLVNWGNGSSGTIYLLDSMNGTGCKANTQRSVLLNPIPSAYFTAIQQAGGVTLIPSESGLACKWQFGDGDTSNYGVPNHFYLSNGTYTINLHVQSAKGCVNDSSMDVNITSVGMEDLLAGQFKMNAYPNPFNGKANISFELRESSNVQLAVYDLTGRLVEMLVDNQKLSSGKMEFVFDAGENHANAGVYIIALKVNDQSQYFRLLEASGK